MKKYCLTVLFLSLFFSGDAIDFSRVNVAWQYDSDAEIRMAHRVCENEDGIFVFLKIVTDSLVRWQYEFLLQDSYESQAHESLQSVLLDTLNKAGNRLDLKLQLPRLEKDLLVIKVSKFDQSYYYDVGLKIGNLSYPSVYPTDHQGLPIYRNFIKRSGHSWNGSDSIHAIRYLENFARADAPMGDMKPIAPTADQDSSFMAGPDPTFKDNHFYVVRSDSNQSSGATVLKVPPYFPEYRRLTELVEAMLYLTSEAEEKAFLKSKDLKKAFDAFWINNLNTKPRARNAIRKYFESVKVVNMLFTDFKPGWKSDRGMIYLIYGKPDEVYRLDGLEEWYFDTGEAFEFNVISSFFAPRTYSLRRNLDFEESWFQHIAEIRKGIR